MRMSSDAETETLTVIAACDRFEADWRAGRRPRIEDFLAKVSASSQSTGLLMLLALELSIRGDRGERPAREEYLDRFPDRSELIERAFDEQPGDSIATGDTRERRAEAET